jgi:hypothetical protein
MACVAANKARKKQWPEGEGWGVQCGTQQTGQVHGPKGSSPEQHDKRAAGDDKGGSDPRHPRLTHSKEEILPLEKEPDMAPPPQCRMPSFSFVSS